MKTRMLTRLFAATIALAPNTAFAQEECPVADVGHPCDAGIAGTCISATCSDSVDGSATTRQCSACVMLPANTCTDAGQPCGDGGLCSAFGAGGGGGSASGQSSFMITYSLATCQYPGSATGDDGGSRNQNFADAALTTGEGNPKGADDAGGSSAHGGSAASPNSSGCAISRTPVRAQSALCLFALGAMLVVWRRRSKPQAPARSYQPGTRGQMRPSLPDIRVVRTSRLRFRKTILPTSRRPMLGGWPTAQLLMACRRFRTKRPLRPP